MQLKFGHLNLLIKIKKGVADMTKIEKLEKKISQWWAVSSQALMANERGSYEEAQSKIKELQEKADLLTAENVKEVAEVEAPKTMLDVEKGDILYYSWGYEQTNVWFYEVTRTSLKSFWIKRIGSKTSDAVAWGVDYVEPDPRHVIDKKEIAKRKAKYVSMDHGGLYYYKYPVLETSYY